ncbi:MAG: thioredoxin family protein [Salinivirgaceae bacterium]|nr:thioredoxin family protein [Salinivirgaceae bacterium]
MLKKILSWFVFVCLFLLIIIGFATKDKLTQYLSESIAKNASPEIIKSGDALIDSLFNYSMNDFNYEVTFLEFGAKGCTACRKMETVMDEVREKYPNMVNVVFLNILLPESQTLMKYYGIAAIPTQVLLDKNGKEFFRHTGYLSTPELTKTIINDDSIK